MPVSPPSIQEIEAVIALEAQPALRNLRITQGYHDLSRALATVLGDANLNWCTFAVWASKTAGRFVRGELAAMLRDAVQSDRRLAQKLDRINALIRRIDGDTPLGQLIIIEALKAPVRNASRFVTSGNLAVFAELGPLFAKMCARLAQDATYDAGSLAHLLNELSLRPGESAEGGQSLLRDAVGHFYQARFAGDPQSKAERILLANAQTGLHEQARLQSAIAGALQLPLDTVQRALLDGIFGGTASVSAGARLRRVLDTAGKPLWAELNADLARIWRECMTRSFMTLRLPEGEIHLGQDLRTSPGQKPFPAALQSIELAELRSLLAAYKAEGSSALASGAADWADISERMRFILTLFRARQQDRRLFEEPFGDAQRRDISAGQMPEGAL